jgi:hypothetical protein
MEDSQYQRELATGVSYTVRFRRRRGGCRTAVIRRKKVHHRFVWKRDNTVYNDREYNFQEASLPTLLWSRIVNSSQMERRFSATFFVIFIPFTRVTFVFTLAFVCSKTR